MNTGKLKYDHAWQARRDADSHFHATHTIPQDLLDEYHAVYCDKCKAKLKSDHYPHIASTEQLLNIPFINVHYVALNDYYQNLVRCCLDLMPYIPVESIGYYNYRTAQDNVSSIDKIKLALSLIDGYYTLQFIEFDLEDYFDGKKYFNEYFNLNSKLITSILQSDNHAFLLNRIHDMFYKSESVEHINHNLIKGILTSNNQKAIDMVMDLLKAARLSEGLRSNVISNMDSGTVETLKLILQYVRDENLTRFSSVKQSISFRIGLECPDSPELTALIDDFITCVLDDKVDHYLASHETKKVYLALCVMSLYEVNDTINFIYQNYKNAPPHIVAIYCIFLIKIQFPINAQMFTYALNTVQDKNNLLYLAYFSPKLIFNSDNDKREYILAALKTLVLITPKSSCSFLNLGEKMTNDGSYFYKEITQYTHELDDLYEETYAHFEAYGCRLYSLYNVNDSKYEIKHPVMRRILIDGMNSRKSNLRDFSCAMIIKLKLELTNDECLSIANGFKSKASSARNNISTLLSLRDEQTILNLANVLLDDKNKLRQAGAVSLLAENIEKLRNNPDFMATQQKVASMSFSDDLSANLAVLLKVKNEEDAPIFFDNQQIFEVPPLEYDQALVDEFFNVDMGALERTADEFMAIFNQHHGEDYQATDYLGNVQIKKIGFDILFMECFKTREDESYKQFMFHEEFLPKLKEFSDDELVLLEISSKLVLGYISDVYGYFRTRSAHSVEKMKEGKLPNILDQLDHWDESSKHKLLNLLGVLKLNQQYRTEVTKDSVYESADINKTLLHYLAFLTQKEQHRIDKANEILNATGEKCKCINTVRVQEYCERCERLVTSYYPDLTKLGIVAVDKCFDSAYLASLIVNMTYLHAQVGDLPCESETYFQLVEANLLDENYIYQLIFNGTIQARSTQTGSTQGGAIQTESIQNNEIKNKHYFGKFNYASKFLCPTSKKLAQGETIAQQIETEIYLKSTDYMVNVELDRTESDTEYSQIISLLNYFVGAEMFIKALARMGNMAFVRGYSWRGHGKKDSFSNIISNVRPEKDLTQEQFDALVEEYNIDDQRLLEASLYNIQFISFAEKRLKIKGLTKAAFYFKAHMRKIPQKDTIHIARYSDIDPVELMNGQMDIRWFKESYAELGKNNFENVYNAAKNLTSGGEHKRAQYFADAVMGKLKIKEVEDRIKEKRNQEMVLAYGLLPLSGNKDNAALKRYKLLQAFLKESKKFGAQKRQSESFKVTIAINNLARTYGVEPERFIWIMEAKLIEKFSESFTPKNIGEVDVYLDLSNVKNPDIVVIKEGKTLKTIPTKYRKHKYITELKEIKKQLKDQYVRARKTLEESMINEDNYSLEDLKQINSHPIVHKLLQDLLFISDDNIGFFKADEQDESDSLGRSSALVNLNGTAYPLTDDSKLRIAHPVDLVVKSNSLSESQWPAWQTYVMENAIQQPFKQIFRELYTMTEEEQLNDGFTNRFAGYQIESNRMLGIMKSLGWVINDCEGFEKISHKHNLRIDMYCYADWFMPSSIEQPAIEKVVFMDNKTGQSKEMKSLSKIIYSETMRDIDLVVSVAYVGGVDPMLNHTTLEMRKRILEHNLSLFKIDNYTLDDKHIMIKGSFGNYSIHLGSGIIHMEGRGMLPVFPVHSQQRGHIFLPFVDEDPKTSEIMTKVLMLAKDNTIKDPTVLQHLK